MPLRSIQHVPFEQQFYFEGERWIIPSRQICRNPEPIRVYGLDNGQYRKLDWGTQVDYDEKAIPLAFDELDHALSMRAPEWTKGNDDAPQPCGLFRAVELGGEAGEVLNEVKKLERTRLGMVGGKTDVSDLADELGDVIISAALIARKYNIDLNRAVRVKFNKTSTKHGFQTKL